MNNIFAKKFLLTLITFMAFTNVCLAQCPIPPTQTSPSLSVKIDYDKKTNLYTYAYTLQNQRDAQIPIGSLFLLLKEKPLSNLQPSKWLGKFYHSNSLLPSRFIWSTLSQNIKAGSAEKFVLKSPKPPGPIKYYVSGDTEVPTSPVPMNSDDDPEAFPDCPGFYFDKPLFDSMTTGITQGPMDENVIPMKVQVRRNKLGPDRLKIRDEIRPYQETGLLTLSVKSSNALDVSDIDLSSLRFGAGKASPAWSELRPGRECEDRDDDKIERSKQKLWLQFELDKVEIECDRDKVLYLEGKTKDGLRSLLGTVSVRVAGCDQVPTNPIKKNLWDLRMKWLEKLKAKLNKKK